MSRRHRADKRDILPDPKFGNVVVTKFMNSVMHAGKKSVAENIVYGAFDIIELMNLVTSRSWNFGSGSTSRRLTSPLRGMGIPFGRRLRHPLDAGARVHLGRFAPYFDRRCLRFFTPCVSSTPRRM